MDALERKARGIQYKIIAAIRELRHADPFLEFDDAKSMVMESLTDEEKELLDGGTLTKSEKVQNA